ncbi:hypothetical protein [Streptomyces adustus]|uniref:hypothetical protein n=1 Tax=Streptomyces adustus TaxID=1609272 RepID=UPI00371EA90C
MDVDVGAPWMVVHQPYAATLTSAVRLASLPPVLFLPLPEGGLAAAVTRTSLPLWLSPVTATG